MIGTLPLCLPVSIVYHIMPWCSVAITCFITIFWAALAYIDIRMLPMRSIYPIRIDT